MKARRFLNLIMASLVAMAYTSCSNSDDVIDTPDPIVKTYTMTVDAQKGSNGTRALSLEGSTLNSTWTEGDAADVYKGENKIGTLTAQSTGANTSLKGTLSGDLNVNDNLTLKYLSADYNSQDGTLTGTAKSIDKVCDYSTATVTVSGIAGGNISTTNANFANQQAVIKFTLKNADGASLGNPTAFSVTDGTSTVTLSDIPAETYTTNGNGVLYVAFPASGASATITLSATVSGVVYGLAKTDITFTNSKYYGVTVKMKETKTDVLPGKFTVNGSGVKVQFSKGNLQLTAADTWAFATNQWECFGTSQSDNHRDLFGWGTGNNPNETSSSYDYSSFTDWGNNPNLQSQLGTSWRTLTQAEWDYLFKTRTATTVNGTTNARYAKAKVNNVQGVILFPDTYTHPDGVTLPVGINVTDNTGWNGNVYDATAWGKMESAGCVFLPAAGYRDGDSVNGVGDDGVYWSSTADEEDTAFVADFDSDDLSTYNAGYCSDGYSVRLVRQVE